MDIKLTSAQLDALKEIATIGAGNAATGLSGLLKKRVNIKVPASKMVRIEEIAGFLGGPESLVAAVYCRLTGKFLGSFFIIFPLEEALMLTDILLDRKEANTKILDEFSSSALKELGNISTGSYLLALSEITKLRITHSIPCLATDMLQAVLDSILIELAQEAEHVLILDTEFKIENNKIKGNILFIPEPEGLKNIIAALKI